ncbi:MAG: hypothetical protein JO359_10000 [Candidatus Eremiobacteraeota bacterium]|nr:hypothetical protein [Candidatus Eremiobacteraeota bacterium]
MIAHLPIPAAREARDALTELAWQTHLAPAGRGLFFALRNTAPSDETILDELVAHVRHLLPETEYGMQIVRAYAAPGLRGNELRKHFLDAIGSRMPRTAERLLLLVEGFELLDAGDRSAHLAALRLALRLPYVVVLVATDSLEQRERRFFDRIFP